MRAGYCVQGPDFAQRPARLASAAENRAVTGTAWDRRFASQMATELSPSPSTRSRTYSHADDPSTRARAASPQIAGRPLMHAMFWRLCIGVSPISAPCWIAKKHDSGLPLKSLGAKSVFATTLAKRSMSSNVWSERPREDDSAGTRSLAIDDSLLSWLELR